MQTRRDDLVELTMMWDRGDYARLFWILQDRSAVLRYSFYAVCLVVGAAGWWIYDDIPPAVAWLVIAVVVAVAPWAARQNRLRTLPDRCFAPVTYRFDEEGVHWIGPHGRMTTPWASVQSVRVEKGFWRIFQVGGETVLPLRCLTEADQSALRAIFAYYAHLSPVSRS